MVKEAQGTKVQIQELTDHVTGMFVQAVLAMAVTSSMTWGKGMSLDLRAATTSSYTMLQTLGSSISLLRYAPPPSRSGVTVGRLLAHLNISRYRIRIKAEKLN
ncbi:hypothetical protein A3K69_05775 [Candidatus Bathyarchaeota archaeon RBG_16_57_9]|nr:MAG: hypothetical protein A3K69_05775 [Candidatus Bathyarchaeota archaeon RBG_16_57_9]